MGLNLFNKNTYHLVDDEGFMQNLHEAQNPDILKAHGDAIGHNADAFFAYYHKPFIDVIKNCYVLKTENNKTFLQGYRSPHHVRANDLTMSRDHILNTLILMKFVNDPFLKTMSKKLRWKISDKYNFTIESWLWMKGIAGSKFYMFLYYLIDIPVMFFSVLWNKIIYKLGGFGNELSQDKFVLIPENEIPSKQKKYRKMIYPMYAFYSKSFQLYVSPNSLGKKILKKICLWGIDKQNFLLRIMFGANVNKNDVYSYKPMYGGRWSTHLNNLNDRFLKIIENPIEIEENVVDVDLLIKIYNRINNK